MPFPQMMRLEEPLNDESSDRFDRTKFSQKMASFDNLIGNSNGSIDATGIGNNDQDVLSLDDSIAESAMGTQKNSSSPSHAGALEQTLKLAPVKRGKTTSEYKSPKSAATRKGLGLARFLKDRSQSSHDNNGNFGGHKSGEGSMPDLEPIWQYSDIMSVGAASKAAKSYAPETTAAAPAADEDNRTVATRKSVYTYHPGSGTTSDQLWDRATKTIAAAKKKDLGPRRSLSVGPTAIPPRPSVIEQQKAKNKPVKRSLSLDPSRISAPSSIPDLKPSSIRSGRRKLKKKPKEDRLCQSDRCISRKSPITPLVSPSTRDTKSRLRVPSKAAQGLQLDVENMTELVIDGGRLATTIARDETLASPPKGEKTKHKKHKVKKSKAIPGEQVVANMGALESKERAVESKTTEKKKRSKSLSRVNLYDHESAEMAKRDPLKRRVSKREPRLGHPRDGQSISSSPKPNRHSSATASLAGGQRRLSRRQLLKKMDSESVISAPVVMSSSANLRGGRRSCSPRPGRTSTTQQLPRRGDSRRNYPLRGSSLPQPNGASPRDVVEEASSTKKDQRGDSRRSLMNSGSSSSNHGGGVSSAKTLRRKLSTDPDDRRALMKRMESVNSFFGKGVGEIGSAYPSRSKRNLVIDDDEDEKIKKPESLRRKSKKSDKKPSRNLTGQVSPHLL